MPAYTITRAADLSGWIAARNGTRDAADRVVLGKFPSYHVAQVACEIDAAVTSAKAEG